MTLSLINKLPLFFLSNTPHQTPVRKTPVRLPEIALTQHQDSIHFSGSKPYSEMTPNEIKEDKKRRSIAAKNWQATRDPQERSAATRKGNKTRGAKGRSAATRKANETRGAKGRSAATRKANETLGADKRSAIAKARQENLGSDRRSATSRKAYITRKLNNGMKKPVNTFEELPIKPHQVFYAGEILPTAVHTSFVDVLSPPETFHEIIAGNPDKKEEDHHANSPQLLLRNNQPDVSPFSYLDNPFTLGTPPPDEDFPELTELK
jgi:hypothetical protein